MSKKVTNPNQKSSAGFIGAIVAVVVIVAAVIAYIVINGQGAAAAKFADREFKQVNAEMKYEGDTLTFGDASSAPHVELYEDFSCPHCAHLAEATDAEALEEINAGNLAVTIHPMTFLDNQGDGHSTQAVAALLALAEHDEPAALWNLREAMFENQQDIAHSWSADDYADAAAQLQASDEAVADIRSGKFLEKAAEAGEKNGKDLESKVGRVSTPRVLMDGKDLEVDDINDWVKVAVASK